MPTDKWGGFHLPIYKNLLFSQPLTSFKFFQIPTLVSTYPIDYHTWQPPVNKTWNMSWGHSSNVASRTWRIKLLAHAIVGSPLTLWSAWSFVLPHRSAHPPMVQRRCSCCCPYHQASPLMDHFSPHCSFPCYRSIMWGFCTIHHPCNHVAAKCTTRFGGDDCKWLGTYIFKKKKYSSLYNIARKRSDTIEKVLSVMPLKISFRKYLTWNNLLTWNSLVSRIMHVQFNNNEDVFKWNLHQICQYSVQ
jgi:hypothetical protein